VAFVLGGIVIVVVVRVEGALGLYCETRPRDLKSPRSCYKLATRLLEKTLYT